MNDDRNDRLSTAYRDAATATVPPALDEKILARARLAARPGRGWQPRWMLPAAWAATIGLCLVIVVDSVRQPGSGTAPATVEAPAVEAKSEPRANARFDDVAAEQDRRATSESLEEAFAPANESMLDEAEAVAGARNGDDQPAALAAPAPAAVRQSSDTPIAVEARRIPARERAFDAVADACDAELRVVPGDWYECIVALREAGREIDAEREWRLLLAEFPDFEAQ